MKKISSRILIFLMLSIVISCHHNRLKTNEKELAKEITIQEREKEDADRAANEKKLADTLNHHNGGFRLKENRSVDKAHPPIVIDLAGSLNNVKEINLSDVASGITYVRMEPVPDSTLPADLKFNYHLMDKNIVAVNLYGIHLYTKDGRYIHSIVKNRYTGMQVTPGNVMFRNDYTKRGAGLSVWSDMNKLFYNYSNNITGQKYIMEYDCSSNQLVNNYQFDPEKPDQISGLGKIAIDLNNGKTLPPKPHNPNGMFGGRPEWFFREMNPFMLDQSTYSVPSYDDKMMIILNNRGDTLSTFTKLEQLKNYSKSMERWGDLGTHYEHNGKLYLRPGSNDTVFEVVPPNRLFPVYTLQLGVFKTSMQEGVDPDFNLSGKIIPCEWAETNDLIFITYTKDSFDCPNTRKNKTVKIYHALYSKLSHQLLIINGDPYDYSPEILKNNIDGGMPVWPSSYMTGKNGELLISVKGKELKDRVKSEQFKVSKAPEVKKKELEKLAQVVSNNEDILMIVK
jgi:hypothetical protein